MRLFIIILAIALSATADGQTYDIIRGINMTQGAIPTSPPADTTGFPNLNGGKNIYIAPWGNDAFAGTNTTIPIRTITRLNNIMSTINIGDSILFRGNGYKYFGTIVMVKSGSSLYPITIGSYGSSGVNPIISGLTTLGGWTSGVAGVKIAQLPAGKNTLNLVLINNKPVAVGRYPNPNAINKGYLILESFSGRTAITDNQLTSSPNWTGAEMILMAKNWWTERTRISNHSGGTLTYRPSVPNFSPSSSTAPNLQTPDAGRGYFIQRDPRTLDQFSEWYFDTTGTKSLQMYFGAALPTDYTVQASILDTLLSLNTRQYITVENIDFEGANAMGIYSSDGGNIKISNCRFYNMGSRGIFVWNAPNLLIDGCYFNNVLSSSIDVDSHRNRNVTVTNCSIFNNATLVGMLEQWSDADGKAIIALVDSTTNNNNLLIEKNDLHNVGFAGIQFQGSNALIQKNFIDTFNFVKDDDGGIYTYQSGTDASPEIVYKNRKIVSNIVLHGIGVQVGGFPTDCEAIYLDGRSSNIEIFGNTTGYTINHGIYANNPNNVYIHNNTCFNNTYSFGWSRYSWGSNTGLNVKSNLFFGSNIDGGALEYVNTAINQPTTRTIQDWLQTGIGNIDSNIYFNRKKYNFRYWYQTADNPSATGLNFNTSPIFDFYGWRTYTTNKDLHSTDYAITPFTVNSVISANLVTNGTYNSNITGTTVGGGYGAGSWDGTSKLTGTGSLKVIFTPLGGHENDLNYTTIGNNIGAVSSAKQYLVRFSTLGGSPYGQARVWMKAASGGATLSDTSYVAFSTGRVNHQVIINHPITNSNGQIVISIEQGSLTTYIDDLEMYEVTADVTDYSSKVRFEYNEFGSSKLINLGSNVYYDVFGTSYTGIITLPPYTSVILILVSP